MLSQHFRPARSNYVACMGAKWESGAKRRGRKAAILGDKSSAAHGTLRKVVSLKTYMFSK